VLKPGGVLATLDFYRPQSRWWRALFLAYLRAAGNWVGWLWHRQPVVYGYIAASIEHFVSWQRFSTALEAHGLRVEAERTKLLGGIALHVARKTT
jgi:demethylmenaquinone methyltransferase/2-methoxy-6-polyprenyl-1,4-benzoquinol methylase